MRFMNEKEMERHLERTLKEAGTHQLKLPFSKLKPPTRLRKNQEKSSSPFSQRDFLTRKSVFIKENKD